jgi:hypothetical protein
MDRQRRTSRVRVRVLARGREPRGWGQALRALCVGFLGILLWLGAGGWLCVAVQAQLLRGDLSLLGQVRDGAQSHGTEVPTNLYGQLGIDRLHGRIGADSYFRLADDLANNDTATDFYAGYLRAPFKTVDFTLGRQFLNEVPGTVFVADAGKVRVDGGPVALTVFGGQPQYFEPTYGAASLSQDEQIVGATLSSTRWRDSILKLGYLWQQRENYTLRQLVTGSASHTFASLPGRPRTYGVLGMDADRQNIEQATAGFDSFFGAPRLGVNFESGYYKPQDHGKYVNPDINRRQDPIFELFSVSQMLQFRSGLRYLVARSLTAYCDYSFQRYEALKGVYEDGNLGSVGLMWLPFGDGLEVVRLEYYVMDSYGGNVNGGKLYYENRLYDRIVFRSKLDIAGYQKVDNRSATVVNGFLGLGYYFTRNLLAEVSMEANHNPQFDEDFRFGFFITYRFRYRPFERSQASTAAAPATTEKAPS